MTRIHAGHIYRRLVALGHPVAPDGVSMPTASTFVLVLTDESKRAAAEAAAAAILAEGETGAARDDARAALDADNQQMRALRAGMKVVYQSLLRYHAKINACCQAMGIAQLPPPATWEQLVAAAKDQAGQE